MSDTTGSSTEVGFQQIDQAFPNIFIYKKNAVYCVDCRIYSSVVSKDVLHYARMQVKSSVHTAKAKKHGASSSKRFDLLFQTSQ